MDLISKEKLVELSNRKDEIHISIYLPTHRTGAEAQQDPVR